MTLARHAGIAIVAGVVLLALTSRLDSYRQYQVAEVAATVVAVAGLTILIGLSGQISDRPRCLHGHRRVTPRRCSCCT